MSPLNQLDLNLLKALNALLEERHVTKAAERLSLTQPAVSGMLARLRHYFNDPILVRTAKYAAYYASLNHSRTSQTYFRRAGTISAAPKL
ncbi:helix-turn-helix domain-containing protein [Rodentibacter genomosp. 2]|uniref:helix-turn-helix domain-containing protein n=1 Tax=Rodentibacter genomosp. 2 TaxID=1908266 RepID=UPI001ABEFA76